MGLIVYGVAQTPIGIDEYLVKCPACEAHNWADVQVVGHYFHVSSIPFFPTDKEANIICKTCGLKRYGIPFDQNLMTNYPEIKRNYRHPWFTYIGLSVMIVFFVLIVMTAIS